VRPACGEQNGDLAVGQERANALGKRAGPRRRLAELVVEIVQKLPDRLGVCDLRGAYGGIRAVAHGRPRR
jgi:hypothetical protein